MSLLALLQAEVEAVGGRHIAGDTDALIVVASRDGGLVPCPGGDRRLPDGTPGIWALSWTEVDAIRDRLNRLNPYDRTGVPDLFKLEDESYDRAGVKRVELRCTAIAPKRYALAEIAPDGSTDIRRASRHGLGYFMPPTVRPTFEEPAEVPDVDWHRRLGGGAQGGISPSRTSPNVIIFSDLKAGSTHGYIANLPAALPQTA